MIEKEESLKRVVQQLLKEDPAWTTVDHWEADLCAIGITSVANPRRLVYISTFKQPLGKYFFESETPRGPDETDYKVADTAEGVDFATLLAAIRRHLGVSSPARTRSPGLGNRATPGDYRVPSEAVELMNSILTEVPPAALRILDERAFHGGSPVPHLEMGAVTAWVCEVFGRAARGGRHSADELAWVDGLFRLLEQRTQAGDPQVDDVIFASFLENLQGDPHLSAILQRLPPKLAASYARFFGAGE